MRLCYSILFAMSLLVITSSGLVLTGCGQKGALYLPPQNSDKAIPDTAPADKAEAGKAETKKKKSQQ